jgi:hypothetical protein
MFNSTIKEKMEMIFSFKDLKPFLQMADSNCVPVDCYLSDGEAPAIFSLSIQNQGKVFSF